PFFKFFVIIMYFVSVSSAFAQTDSLANKSYDELVKLYRSTAGNKPAAAKIYITKAYELVSEGNDTRKIAKTLYGISYANYLLTNNIKALEDLENVILLLLGEQKKSSGLLFQAYNLKGTILTDIGKNSEALDAYLKAKIYAREGKKIRNEILASTNIAFIKKEHKDFKEAIRIFKENLELLKKLTVPASQKVKDEVYQLANIADAYLRMGEMTSENYTKEARNYNGIGFKKCSKKDDTVSYAFLLINEVRILYQEGKINESIALATETEHLGIANQDENLLCTVYVFLGKNYAKLKNYKQAIAFLEKGNEIILTSEKKYYIERLLVKELSKSYTALGDIEKGQKYFEKYAKLVETELEEDIKVIKEVYIRNDIAELREELKELKAIMLSEKRQKQRLYYIVGILVLLAVTGIIWYQKNAQKLKKRITSVLQKVNELENEQVSKKPSSNSISEKVTDTKAALLLQKLQKFEEEKVYLLPDCSLSFVAEHLDSNTSYVSNVINNYKNKSFKTYITELRINTALIQLKNDARLHSYTIKAIAEEFGFKRQETFSKAFKQHTGIYPSQYLKKIRNQA
uniref:helix-turn-helix domain-containing protein n=1 Tax=Kordia jejudonensis TaxID=1348245 RepID=UPI0006294D1E